MNFKHLNGLLRFSFFNWKQLKCQIEMNGMNAKWKEISRFSFHQKCNNAWYAARWRVFCVCEREKNFRKQNLCKIATGLMHALLCSFIPVRFLIVLVIFYSSIFFLFSSIFHLFHQFLHNLLERNSFTIEYKWNVFIRVQL